MANKIQIKRGLKSNLPTLNVGEPALCTDTKEVFIGSASGNVQLAKTEYISNPNLLINGDFQIWQRGENFSGISGGMGLYTADRWLINSMDKHSAIRVGNGIKMTVGTMGWIGQLIEIEKDLFNRLPDKLTLSFKIKTNITHRASIQCSLLSTSKNIGYTLEKSSEYKKYEFILAKTMFDYDDTRKCIVCMPYRLLVNLPTGLEVDITDIKLEIGEIATPLSPRPYGEEKALCQRYYQIINVGGRSKFITQNQVVFQANYPVKMRLAPTIKEINAQVTKIDATPISGFLLKYPAIQEDLLVADFHKVGHGLSDASGGVVLALDSELY